MFILILAFVQQERVKNSLKEMLAMNFLPLEIRTQSNSAMDQKFSKFLGQSSCIYSLTFISTNK